MLMYLLTLKLFKVLYILINKTLYLFYIRYVYLFTVFGMIESFKISNDKLFNRQYIFNIYI